MTLGEDLEPKDGRQRGRDLRSEQLVVTPPDLDERGLKKVEASSGLGSGGDELVVQEREMVKGVLKEGDEGPAAPESLDEQPAEDSANGKVSPPAESSETEEPSGIDAVTEDSAPDEAVSETSTGFSFRQAGADFGFWCQKQHALWTARRDPQTFTQRWMGSKKRSRALLLAVVAEIPAVGCCFAEAWASAEEDQELLLDVIKEVPDAAPRFVDAWEPSRGSLESLLAVVKAVPQVAQRNPTATINAWRESDKDENLLAEIVEYSSEAARYFIQIWTAEMGEGSLLVVVQVVAEAAHLFIDGWSLETGNKDLLLKVVDEAPEAARRFVDAWDSPGKGRDLLLEVVEEAPIAAEHFVEQSASDEDQRELLKDVFAIQPRGVEHFVREWGADPEKDREFFLQVIREEPKAAECYVREYHFHFNEVDPEKEVYFLAIDTHPSAAGVYVEAWLKTGGKVRPAFLEDLAEHKNLRVTYLTDWKYRLADPNADVEMVLREMVSVVKGSPLLAVFYYSDQMASDKFGTVEAQQVLNNAPDLARRYYQEECEGGKKITANTRNVLGGCVAVAKLYYADWEAGVFSDEPLALTADTTHVLGRCKAVAALYLVHLQKQLGDFKKEDEDAEEAVSEKPDVESDAVEASSDEQEALRYIFLLLVRTCPQFAIAFFEDWRDRKARDGEDPFFQTALGSSLFVSKACYLDFDKHRGEPLYQNPARLCQLSYDLAFLLMEDRITAYRESLDAEQGVAGAGQRAALVQLLEGSSNAADAFVELFRLLCPLYRPKKDPTALFSSVPAESSDGRVMPSDAPFSHNGIDFDLDVTPFEPEALVRLALDHGDDARSTLQQNWEVHFKGLDFSGELHALVHAEELSAAEGDEDADDLSGLSQDFLARLFDGKVEVSSATIQGIKLLQTKVAVAQDVAVVSGKAADAFVSPDLIPAPSEGAPDDSQDDGSSVGDIKLGWGLEPVLATPDFFNNRPFLARPGGGGGKSAVHSIERMLNLTFADGQHPSEVLAANETLVAGPRVRLPDDDAPESHSDIITPGGFDSFLKGLDAVTARPGTLAYLVAQRIPSNLIEPVVALLTRRRTSDLSRLSTRSRRRPVHNSDLHSFEACGSVVSIVADPTADAGRPAFRLEVRRKDDSEGREVDSITFSRRALISFLTAISSSRSLPRTSVRDLSQELALSSDVPQAVKEDLVPLEVLRQAIASQARPRYRREPLPPLGPQDKKALEAFFHCVDVLNNPPDVWSSSLRDWWVFLWIWYEARENRRRLASLETPVSISPVPQTGPSSRSRRFRRPPLSSSDSSKPT